MIVWCMGRVATRLVELAEEMVEPANPSVLSDVGVAAAAARAALSASVTNIVVNATFLDDAEAEPLRAEVAALERMAARADEVAARVVERLAK